VTPSSGGSSGIAALGSGPTIASSSSSEPGLMEVGEGLAVGTGRSAGEDSAVGCEPAVTVLSDMLGAVGAVGTVGATRVSPSSSQGVVGDGTSVGTGISVGDCGAPEERAELAMADEANIADSRATGGCLAFRGTGGSVGEGRSVGTGSSLGDCVAAEDESAAAEEYSCGNAEGGRTTSGGARAK